MTTKILSILLLFFVPIVLGQKYSNKDTFKVEEPKFTTTLKSAPVKLREECLIDSVKFVAAKVDSMKREVKFKLCKLRLQQEILSKN